MSEVGVIKRGWLNFSEDGGKKWKKKWFLLYENSSLIAKDSANLNATISGHINLAAATFIGKIPIPNKFAFIIVTPEKTYTFDAESPVEFESWLNLLSLKKSSYVSPTPYIPPVNSSPLPQGWEMRYDQSGKPYFVNHYNKTTTYQDPRLAPTVAPQTPTSPALPPGWEARVDQYGKTYYIDHMTKTTTYNHPMSPNTNTVYTSKPLPPGWEMRYDQNGKPYFIDHMTKKTTYDDPRLRPSDNNTQQPSSNETNDENVQKLVDALKLLVTLDELEKQQKGQVSDADAKIAMADEYFKQGSQFSKQNRTDDAILAYSEALKLDPQFYQAYTSRGFEFLIKGIMDEAFLDFNTAIKLAPTYSMAYFGRANAFGRLSKLDDGIADLTQAILLNPKELQYYRFRAMLYMDKGEYEKALSDCNKMMEVDSKSLLSNTALADVYDKMGKYDLAIGVWTKVIALDPSTGDWYGCRGNDYLVTAQYSLALADLNKAISLRPKAYSLYVSRGVCSKMMDKIDEAISDYNTAIQLNTLNGGAFENRATAFCIKGDLPAAMKDSEKAIELNNESSDAWKCRGLTYLLMGELDKAIPDFIKGQELRSEECGAYYLAVCYRKKGLIDKAIQEYGRILPMTAEGYSARGEAYLAKGQPQQAISDCSQAISLNPKIAEAYYVRHLAYSSIGDANSAQQDAQRSMSLDPKIMTRTPCVVKFHPEKVTYNLGNKFQNVWLSAMKGNIEEVATFLVNDGSVDAIDITHNNNSILYCAARSGKVAMVKFLIECGADVNLKQKHGSTPLHAAAYGGHKEVVEVLLQNGAILLKNQYGDTPIEDAKNKNFTEIVKILQDWQKNQQTQLSKSITFTANASSEPWKFTEETFKSPEWKQMGAYSLLDLKKTLNKEYQYVESLFYQTMGNAYKTNCKVTSIQAILNKQLQIMFEGRLESLAIRCKKEAFKPKWIQAKDAAFRTQIIERMKRYITSTRKGVSIIPVWHGTKAEIAKEIAETGFANLGTTDDGFFGNGIYGTPQSEYAVKVYGKGCVVLCFMSVLSAFPVVLEDMPAIKGGPNVGNHDAHFAPVVPMTPKPNESVYLATKQGQIPVYDELIVFQETQIIPVFIVNYTF